ncbi:MAG TPA: hypothetical protein PK668_12860 [Myxococcota bacterium]|nr:hypothetical protein [Myxococcota bacterium]HRY93639.1 hypothetical protein [Myxococcota bacterium]HSA23951.1 hypothetical protein [Myxococcota bacterium]
MYAKAKQGELSDLSEPRVELVRCASELNYRLLLCAGDPWNDPNPRAWLKINKLAKLLLSAPAVFLPDC